MDDIESKIGANRAKELTDIISEHLVNDGVEIKIFNYFQMALITAGVRMKDAPGLLRRMASLIEQFEAKMDQFKKEGLI